MNMSPTETVLSILGISFLVVTSAFFSAAEIAYASVKRTLIEQEARSGSHSAILIKKHYDSFGWTLATILVGNNLVNVALSTIVAALFAGLFTNTTQATIISTVTITPLIVIFGEIFPKIYAKKYAYKYLKFVVYTLEFLNYLLFPITFPLSKLALSSKVTNTEGEIQGILKLASSEGVLEKREATLASNALELDSIPISKIFIPINNVSTIDAIADIKDAINVFIQTGHSRLPVIKDGAYIGALLLKDIIGKDEGIVYDYIIKIPSISKNTLSTIALEKMRKKKTHMALVVESSKSLRVIGIITIEDIVEELIGEIYDEHDRTEEVRAVGLHKFIATGSASMELVQRITGVKFEDSNNLTLKRWISNRINRSIKEKLKYEYKGKIRFRVISNKNKEETIFEIYIK